MTNIFLPLKTWHLEVADYSRDPKVCTDSLGRSWVVWVGFANGEEQLWASHYIPGQTWSPAFAVSEPRACILDLDITPFEDGILLAWIDGEDAESDGLQLRKVWDVQGMSPPALILPRRRSPASVSIASEGDRYFLAFGVRRPGGHEILGFISTSITRFPEPLQLSFRKRMNLSPSVEMAGGHAWVAWQYMTFREGSRVFVRRIENCRTLDDPLELVGTDGSINAACTLKRGDQGVWIAWQSDMDPLSGPGLVRWIELGFLDMQGRFHRPSHKMKDVQRQAIGEDQGFEFPSLVACDDGRLVLFGRGSQSLRRQDLLSEGWTERGQVDPPGWQCRGVYSATLAEEGILVAGREKSAIVVRLLPVGERKKGSGVSGSIADRLDFS
ncbi:MAG: hypothetical protein JXX14_17915, partial [Deltaproteobacteria bacterium]|nr:hypothetical protein [Deltaproteobacteria bacterium]